MGIAIANRKNYCDFGALRACFLSFSLGLTSGDRERYHKETV